METAIKKPVIELKKVKTFRGMEGDGLNAELWMDGHKIAFIIDDARGGEVDYEVFDKVRFAELEAYVKSVPERPIDFGDGPVKKDGKVMMIGYSIDEMVDEVFNAMQKEKAAKKFAKKFDNHIIWGVPNADAYTELKFKIPLSQIPTAKLQELFDKYKAKLQPGEQILNTNVKSLNIKL